MKRAFNPDELLVEASNDIASRLKAAISAQEKERKRIGAELHDNISQVLSTVRLNLELAMKNPVEKDDLIAKSSRALNNIIQEIRKMSRELISPGIKNNELPDLVDDLTCDISRVTGIQFDVDVSVFDKIRITLDEKIAIYRIIQEQLNNIMKHAEAKRVRIQAFAGNKKIMIEIADDGKGFDLSVRKKGIGLINIISRAELFNGDVQIITAPGKGCMMRVTLEIHGP
jgi:signal transduction histidine kinase